MPMSGVGLCCRPSATGDAVRQGVLDFLLLGGRHLDDAKLYNNHREVANGIRQAMDSGVPRSEIFFVTKIWPNDYGFEAAAAWVDQTLSELSEGLDYIDLVLLHKAGVPDGLKCKSPRSCRQETWLALQRAQSEGKIKHLGVSNFGPRQMQELISLGGSPVTVNQLEYHPWVPKVHRETVEWCHQNSIVVTAYGSMGSSGLAQEMMMQDTLKQVGVNHGKTVGQVLLRWAVQNNVSVIPGTSNPKHQAENLRIFDFELTTDELALLNSVPEDQHMLHFGHTPDEAE
jgi:diketogulonate reductase-like aldo/keto reductase